MKAVDIIVPIFAIIALIATNFIGSCSLDLPIIGICGGVIVLSIIMRVIQVNKLKKRA